MSRRRRMTPGRALACALLALSLAGPALAQSGRSALEDAPPSFREWVESLPEGQRRPLLRRLGDMPAHRRNRMFQRWEALEEGERREFQAFLEERAAESGESAPGAAGERPFRRRLESLPPESRENLAPLVRRWRGMEPGERRRMRERLERFRVLSPEDQQALIDKKFETKSPEERARILESLRDASEALPRRPLLEAAPEPPIAPAPER